jgi:hypothetical protein
MKVSPGGGASRASGPRAAARAGEGGFRVGAGEPAAAGAVGGAAATPDVGALLALQSAGEEAGKRQRNRAALERMLAMMERVRDEIVDGEVSDRALQALCDAASAKIEDPDPRLSEIAGEIVLRARVELAKRGL